MLAGGVKVPHLLCWDWNRSLPLLIMLTETATRLTTFVAFFFFEDSVFSEVRAVFSEVHADN